MTNQSLPLDIYSINIIHALLAIEIKGNVHWFLICFFIPVLVKIGISVDEAEEHFYSNTFLQADHGDAIPR